MTAKEGADGQFSMAREIDSLPFTYSRPVEGYGWQEGRFSGLAGRVQKGPLLIALSQSTEPTAPPRPDLFIRFARLDPKSLNDIRDFASEYGFLRGGFLFERLPSEGTSSEGAWPANEAKAETYAGETHAQWEADIVKMQAAYQLHKAIREEDVEELKKAITWEGKRITYRAPERISPSGYKIQDSFEIAIDRKPDPDKKARVYRAALFNRIRPGDFIMPARIALQDLINDKMAELVTYQLRWVHNFQRMGEFAVPKCLLGHLWRQLAAALCSFSTIRDCEECGEPMVISPRANEEAGRRRSRHTCSPACRVKRSEKRKRETLRLHRQGLSGKEIVTQVDSSLEQIKRWIEGEVSRRGARRS
jgi:hypothetical protein